MSAEKVKAARDEIKRIDDEITALLERRREAARSIHENTVGAILRRQRAEAATRKLDRVRSMDPASIDASRARTAARLPRDPNPPAFHERGERDAS